MTIKKEEKKMIFNIPGHIELIRNGLSKGDALARIDPNLYQTMPLTIIKTQTRRVNRGIYQVGRDYAVQRKRGGKAEQDIRIVMDKIWKEMYAEYLYCYISEEDAMAEGSYESPIEFEEVFRKQYLKWIGDRWAFAFHVIEVKK